MILSDLSPGELADRLVRGALMLRSGPFTYRLQSRIDSIAEGLSILYAGYPLADAEDGADFSLRLEPSTGLHRWWHRQVRFSSDGIAPFEPLPITHAYPQLEWAMNWCVSSQAHHYLMLHAAVLERDGLAVIMPAPPGSGKSTLCAGLLHRGWRLLSDEMALIAVGSSLLTPMVRPVSLKNRSIELMQAYVPEAVFNQVTHNTSKGSVTHMKVPDEHLRRMDEPATPRWVIFPQYVAGAAATLNPLPRGQSMLELGINSFNYGLLGRRGFETLAQVVAMCDSYRFEYSELDDAVAVFDALLAAHPR